MIIRIILIILIIQIENPDEECRSLLSDNVRWEKRLVCENKQDAIGYVVSFNNLLRLSFITTSETLDSCYDAIFHFKDQPV